MDEVGWYKGNSGCHTHPVGAKKANAWGFHDMNGTMRAFRGGGWETGADVGCPIRHRYVHAPAFQREMIGFRVVARPE